MKRKSFITLLLAVFAAASLLFCGCFGELKDAAKQEISSAKKALNSLTRELDGDGQSSKKSSKTQSSKAESSRQTSAEESSQTDSSDAGYTMADVKALQNTENFAKRRWSTFLTAPSTARATPRAIITRGSPTARAR